MKFQELSVSSQFSIDTSPHIVFTKVQHVKGTCCSKEYNATYKNSGGKRKVMQFAANKEVHII